jgi:hypothetical protein
MISARALTSEEWRTWRELRLAALRDAPEAFDATLADWQGAGDTELRWRLRLEAVSANVVADLDNGPRRPVQYAYGCASRPGTPRRWRSTGATAL